MMATLGHVFVYRNRIYLFFLGVGPHISRFQFSHWYQNISNCNNNFKIFGFQRSTKILKSLVFDWFKGTSFLYNRNGNLHAIFVDTFPILFDFLLTLFQRARFRCDSFCDVIKLKSSQSELQGLETKSSITSIFSFKMLRFFLDVSSASVSIWAVHFRSRKMEKSKGFNFQFAMRISI